MRNPRETFEVVCFNESAFLNDFIKLIVQENNSVILGNQ